MIFLLLILSIPVSAQWRVDRGQLICYTEKYGWSDREVIKQDSVGTGYLEGVYQSTDGADRLTIARSGDHYAVRVGTVIARLDDIGLSIYPTTIGWAERWDRMLRIGKREYLKIR